MQTGLATAEGVVTPDLITHYVARARALGLLIVEHSYVSRVGKLSERQVGVDDDALVEGLERLAGSIHAMGTPIILQLNHAGRAARRAVTSIQPVAPSPTDAARGLEAAELTEVADAFAAAAERAMAAGFDGVEVHGAHGFLLNQFTSPLANQRGDTYGGSWENRIRFPLAVVKAVKARVGGRLLLYRLGAVDLDPAGTTIEESQAFAERLVAAGVDLIDVSGGLCGSRPAQLQGSPGFFVPYARQIKEVVEVPVIGVGRITDAGFADQLIRDGRVDLVAVGRSLLNDAAWAVKAMAHVQAGSR
jgi:2,4-dienoyl-CoA reductase-like NADH-dependent reductase (Old Yellow Enzyme family)